MTMPGVDLVATRFPVAVPNPKAPGGKLDLADVIYGVHRCCHGHGEALPSGFELLPDAAGPARLTRIAIERGKVRLSDRVIFGLLAIAVFSPANRDERVPDGWYLTFGEVILPINDWWGRAADFPALAARDELPSVHLDFGDWLTAE